MTSRLRDNIPAELRELDQWVTWRWEKRHGKMTKPPLTPDASRYAKCDDPSTWGTFAAVCATVDRGHRQVDGVGFMVKDGQPFVGIDLDRCRAPQSGDIAGWALDLIRRFASYAEVSPSASGVRIFIKGLKPGPRCESKSDGHNIEIYNHDRYLTLTGRHLRGTPTTIEERQAELTDLYAELWPEPATEPAPTPPPAASSSTSPTGANRLLSDLEVLELARRASNGAKVERLLAGDVRDYPSSSEADAALLGCLAFYTQDAAQLTRLWLGSGLARKHTENEKYRERTIRFALSHVTETFSAGRPATLAGMPVERPS